MESTVMTTFGRRSTLICFLSSRECPALLKEAWAVMQKYIDLSDLDLDPTSDQKNSPFIKSKDSRYGNLDVDVYQALTAFLLAPRGASAASARPFICREVAFHHEVHQNGVVYTDFCTNRNHSMIYFHRDHDCQSVPAQIRSIFRHKRRDEKGQLIDDIFLAVHEYVPSDDTPFASFPDFRAAIFHREPAPQVQVIRSKQVHCHANQRPWDHARVVMRAIDRVRHPMYLGSSPL
jgi:hypothetical protein